MIPIATKSTIVGLAGLFFAYEFARGGTKFPQPLVSANWYSLTHTSIFERMACTPEIT